MKKEKIIINIAIFLILFFVLDLFFGVVYPGETRTRESYLYIIPSIFFYTLVYAFILVISKSTKKTNIAISTIIFIFAVINHIKILASGNPIFITDMEMLGEAGEISTLAIPVLKEFSTYIPLIALGIFLIMVNYVGSEEKIVLSKLPKYATITVSGICILAITILFLPIQKKDEFLLNKIYRINERKDYEALLSNVVYYKQYGVLGGLIENLLENRNYPPENYNEEILKENLASAKGSQDKIYGKTPNILVIFSEAFFDITQISEVEFDVDVTKNFKELQNEGRLFNLISPAYGGLSSNVEFELLTGGNLAYFSNGYIPFNSLYKDSKSENYPSLIKELNKNGYNTKIVFGKDFYNSEKQYKYIGAKSYEDVDNINFYKGYFNSDEYLTDLMIKELENKEEESLFYFTATIQNHMPFCNDKYLEYDVGVKNTSLGKGETEFILSYAQGIYDADKQLKRLYDYIQNFEEDTVIIFLGDHLPYISLENKDVLADLSYFNTDNKKLNIYRKYHTQALVLTNFEVENKGTVCNSSPDFLLNYVVNNMDIELSDYYKWLYDFSEKLPATNKALSFSNTGESYFNQELPEDLRKSFELRRNMQYMLFK